MGTHESKNTPTEHLDAFYESLDEVLHERFDGLVITGAPVETLRSTRWTTGPSWCG